MLEDLLSKLGASTKITVGVSVSPNVGLEMVEIDRFAGTISKYGNRPLDYNHSSREIADYDQFQSALAELFDELEISTKSNIILCLPNVHFGLISLPVLLTDDAVSNAIISDVEQSYIFKRQEPAISWTEIFSVNETETRTLVYSAVQQSAINEILQICATIGCTVAAIETSYASLLRALSYTDITKEQMREGMTWNLLIIGQNSYSILSMLDKRIMEYYEEPLALKSFIDDEIYNAIMTSAMLTLAGLPANSMLIVSETDLVSAEILTMKMANETKIDFLECNKFAQNEIIPVDLKILPDLACQITPEVIGAVTYPFFEFPIKLNHSTEVDVSLGEISEFAPKINIGNLEIELTPAFVKKTTIILACAVLIPLLIIFIGLGSFFIPQEQSKLDNLNTKKQQLNDEIAKYQKIEKTDTFDLAGTIEKIIAQNKTKLGYYESMGISIPKNLWITYYMTNEAGKVDIKGKAGNVQNVYIFYKGIKELINNSDIRLYKLEMSSESLDDIIANSSSSPKNYEFEITNMSETELNPPVIGPNAQQQNETVQQNQQPTTQNNPFQFGKPFFGQKTEQQGTNPIQPLPTATNRVQPANGDQLPKNLKAIEKF